MWHYDMILWWLLCLWKSKLLIRRVTFRRNAEPALPLMLDWHIHRWNSCKEHEHQTGPPLIWRRWPGLVSHHHSLITYNELCEKCQPTGALGNSLLGTFVSLENRTVGSRCWTDLLIHLISNQSSITWSGWTNKSNPCQTHCTAYRTWKIPDVSSNIPVSNPPHTFRGFVEYMFWMVRFLWKKRTCSMLLCKWK